MGKSNHKVIGIPVPDKGEIKSNPAVFFDEMFEEMTDNIKREVANQILKLRIVHQTIQKEYTGDDKKNEE